MDDGVADEDDDEGDDDEGDDDDVAEDDEATWPERTNRTLCPLGILRLLHPLTYVCFL